MPAAAGHSTSAPRYRRHQPETTALYEVVRDNLETLYGAIDDGVLGVRIPKHAPKELESYLDCGLLCCGFARLRCEDCRESAFALFQEIRRRATQLARATVTRLRHELIKLAARVTSSARRIVFNLPRHFAFKTEWLAVAELLTT